jgi:hypothetical protein
MFRTGSTMRCASGPLNFSDKTPWNAIDTAPVVSSRVPVPPLHTTFWLRGLGSAALKFAPPVHLSAKPLGWVPLRRILTFPSTDLYVAA